MTSLPILSVSTISNGRNAAGGFFNYRLRLDLGFRQGQALLRWLTGGAQLGTERFAYLAQVFFMDELDDVAATRHFMLDLREKMAARVAALEEVERQVRDAAGKPPEEFSGGDLHQFFAIRMGIHSIGAKVTWCDEAIALIDARLEGSQPEGESS